MVFKILKYLTNMPQTETEELYNRLDNLKETNSNSKQADLQDNSDFIQKNVNTGTSQIQKPIKERGLQFFDSLKGSGVFVKKDIKNTMIGIGIGFVIAMLFPPVGIAVMAVSTIVGATVIGTKLTRHSNTKAENNYPKEKTGILSNIIKELMGEKFSKEKQQEKKNGIKEDFKQNTETFTGGISRKVENGNVIKNDGANNSHEAIKSMLNNGSKLAMFTKPLNSLNPNIKLDNIVPNPKVQQKGIQSVNKIRK